MLFGWDATESHSTLVEKTVTDEETGETSEVEKYKFSAAAYRAFTTTASSKTIKPVAKGEYNEEKELHIKFGFKIWLDGSDDIYK